MTAACCSHCDTNIWVEKSEDIKPVLESQPTTEIDEHTPVGGRVWCNTYCLIQWHEKNPDPITILNSANGKTIDIWIDDNDGERRLRYYDQLKVDVEDLPLETG